MPYKIKEDYNKYMKGYMVGYRKQERELIREARRLLNIPLKKRGRKRKMK